MARYSSIPKLRGVSQKRPVAVKKPVTRASRRIGQSAVTGTAVATYPVRPTVATTVNLAGGAAFKMSDRLELATIIVGSYMSAENKGAAGFYESEARRLARLEALIQKEPQFAAKALLWCRHQAGLRTITHVGSAMLAQHAKGQPWLRKFFENVVRRPDDMCETVAAYREIYKVNFIPNAMKAGFRLAFGKFDEHQLAKYQQKGCDPSLADLLNLVHPVANAINRVGLRKLATNKLVVSDTWEAELSAAGQEGTSKQTAWSNLLTENKLQPLALLRNVRNILQAAGNDGVMVNELCRQLVDPAGIRKNVILPFQYITAYREVTKSCAGLKHLGKVQAALSQAAEEACSNIKPFTGNTVVLLDDSGSMNSGGMQLTPAQSGSMLAAILLKVNPTADFVMYNSAARYESVNPRTPLIELADNIHGRIHSGGTNLNAALLTLNERYDNVVVLSDEETWGGGSTPANVALAQYRKRYNATPVCYGFNLAGTGTLQFPEDQVISIAGFTFKVFELLNTLQTGLSSFVAELDKVDVSRTFAFDYAGKLAATKARK